MHAIEYPTIDLGGRTLIVRYSLASRIFLKRKYGIDPRTLAQALHKDNPDQTENLIKLFAACVAENFIDTDRASSYSLDAAPTSDYWLSTLDDGDVKRVDDVVSGAMGKAAEALKRRAAESPTT